jgi:hypothetical protein
MSSKGNWRRSFMHPISFDIAGEAVPGLMPIDLTGTPGSGVRP